ncbi:MAG: MFS transporter [Candidatus Eisenbacteria bacterium]
MSAFTHALRDFRDSTRLFSRPARFYLLAEFLMWTAHGIFSVLFNLYLVEAGFQESFIGRAVSFNAIGLALMALPAGFLAERWGRRNTLMLGAVLEAIGHVMRAGTTDTTSILASSFIVGAGQSFFQIAAAPFLTEHSTPRERTHLFSTFFAAALFAGVVGSAMGGAIPAGLRHAWPNIPLFTAYRSTLLVGALLALTAILPLLALRGLREPRLTHEERRVPPEQKALLWPIALNALLIGAGAGLVIPFMNLYFKDRFQCTSAQIGGFFAVAQIVTASAALIGPALARRFGKLRTAVASELLSLPFLITLGAEQRLGIAVASFWMRATLMQAATPIMQAFVMEVLPPALRARSTSLNNMLWNMGWAISATTAGTVIQHFGYAVPFYITAALYATAALTFYAAFRGVKEQGSPVLLSEEAKGRLGDGPGTD